MAKSYDAIIIGGGGSKSSRDRSVNSSDSCWTGMNTKPSRQRKGFPRRYAVKHGGIHVRCNRYG